MLSSAIIVFREVFEIVLIIGIILAATRNLPRRGGSITAGFALGAIGSALVALFTDRISGLAEGMGQEVFNAGILYIAAFFIGWTVLWMKRHAREMKQHFTSVGQAVAEGSLPFYSLALVIALCLLREGSEIILFIYGMLAVGQSAMSLLAGALIGAATGAIIGFLLYKGLLKLSTRHFFQVTGWLLMLLVAGMALQGTGFLVAAGYFERLSSVAWDSSWLLREQGVLGQSLHALIGYTARPTVIQLLVYALTLGGLIALMKRIDVAAPRPPRANAARSVAGLGVLIAGLSMALALMPSDVLAAKKIYSPYVEQGELELEWQGSYTRDDDDAETDGAQQHKMAIGYGVTDRWFTEIYGELEKSGLGDAESEFTAVEWENRFQLFEPGERWLDVGLYAAYEISLEDGGADKGEVKLLLAKNYRHVTHLANITLEKEIGGHAEEGTEMGFAWSSRYRYAPWLEPGVEWYSDFGPLNESLPYDKQKHQLGPVFYGALGQHVAYDIGYLFGLSDAAPDGELKWILEYEFRF